jgi:hypothetical protein
VGIKTTKTSLSSGFRTKLQKQKHQLSSISNDKNPKSRADDLNEASASPPLHLNTNFPILAYQEFTGLLKQALPMYHKFYFVFERKTADALPIHHSVNHAIDLRKIRNLLEGQYQQLNLRHSRLPGQCDSCSKNSAIEVTSRDRNIFCSKCALKRISFVLITEALTVLLC